MGRSKTTHAVRAPTTKQDRFVRLIALERCSVNDRRLHAGRDSHA